MVGDEFMIEQLKVKLLYEAAKEPTRATIRSAGIDLYACSLWPMHSMNPDGFSLSLPPRRPTLVHTGIAIQLPEGHVGLCCPRSGLASKHNVTVLNTPGVIDEDYRGEVMVLLINHDEETKYIAHGDRIAQLVIVPVTRTMIQVVQELSTTERGDRGFGSSGI